MDDGPLVSVLNAFADPHEQLEALADFQLFLIAVVADRWTGNVFHHKVRLTFRSGAGVEDLGNAGVVHDSEGLALGLKSLKERIVVHTCANELDSNQPLKWSGL